MEFPISIGVCGSKSGIGKTSFIENFVKFFKRSSEELKIIAVKYTKISSPSKIIIEPEDQDGGKDTSRLKKAGADHVIWVKAKDDDLPKIVSMVKKYIYNLNADIALIEGNSIVRFIQPDVIIFLKDSKDEYLKPSAEYISKRADIVISGEYLMEEVMSEIEKALEKKKIYQLLKERSNGGKITCAEARKIAEELSVEYIEVGRAANELGIKIRKCELGCF